MITIQTDADFTPRGKRTARVVTTRGMTGPGRQLRWYVGGRLYNRLAVAPESLELTREWLRAGERASAPTGSAGAVEGAGS